MTTVDVAVVGAGLVGSAVARVLAGYRLDVALLDARADVGDGTSKANTAVLHTGFDAKPGTLEARLVARGHRLLADYAARTGIPRERVGAVVVAWDEEQQRALPRLQEVAERNGCADTRVVGRDELVRLVPGLGEGALAGLSVPGESITCTWTVNLALATEAVRRGVRLLREHRVDAVTRGDAVTTLHTGRGDVSARWVVNAAGLGADLLDGLFGHDRFQLHPRRGELVVLDKCARSLVDRIVLPVPSEVSKGVLVTPTVHGNVLIGPTAEDGTDRTDTATTAAGLDRVLREAVRTVPALRGAEVTATYAGLRPASDVPDYTVEVDAHQRYAVAGGIRSTGLTSCMAVAEHLVGLLAEAGLPLTERESLPDPPAMPNLGSPKPCEDADRIARDPEYGDVVCFCERVTRGEIRDALASTVPPRSPGGLRRRTRAMSGRCQGASCGAEVLAMFDTARNR